MTDASRDGEHYTAHYEHFAGIERVLTACRKQSERGIIFSHNIICLTLFFIYVIINASFRAEFTSLSSKLPV